MENAEKTTSTESKTTTEEKTLKPPIAQLIGLKKLFFFGTLGIIYAGYVHGKMHLLTTLKNAKRILWAKKQHVTKSGDTFEWDETEEVRKAVERLHQNIRDLEKDHGKKGGDYGVGK